MGKTTPKTFFRNTSERFAAKAPKESAFNEPPETSSKKKNHMAFLIKTHIPLKMVLIVVSLLFVAASGVAVYSYNLYQQSQKQIASLKNSTSTSNGDAKKVVAAVSKLMVLPKDETPTIATVTDSKKLKNQAFFSSASNGDKVLIYTKAKKAILFNPTQNKVIEVAPVNIGKNSKAEVAGAAVKAPTVVPTAVYQLPTATIPPQPTIQP